MCDGVFFFQRVVLPLCFSETDGGRSKPGGDTQYSSMGGGIGLYGAKMQLCGAPRASLVYFLQDARALPFTVFVFGAWPVIDPCRHGRPERMNEINIKIKARATIEGVSRSLFLHLVRRLPPFRRPQRVRNRRGRTSRACSEFWNMYAIPPRVLT